MRKQLAACLVAALALVAVPALAADTTIAIEPQTVSVDLTVDDFVLTAVVSTELVAAVRCPVEQIGCSHNNADCGVIPGVCHCKAGGGTLTCVKNPDGGGGPIPLE
jgi:hypothetical protein